MDPLDFRDNLYGNCDSWEQRDGNKTRNIYGEEAYENELKRAKIKSGSRILEIRFGNSGFLDWPRENRYEIVGTEIIEKLVDRAEKGPFRLSWTTYEAD